jgi:hypothetical protein
MGIIKISFINPLTYEEDFLIVKEDYDYNFLRNVIKFKHDEDLIARLDYLLKCLDCTIIYNCGPNCVYNSFTYELYINTYWFYLIHLKNQIIYNLYLDKLLNQHIKNILFDFKNKHISKPKKEKSKKKIIKNEFIRQETNDLFTNEKTYQYVNLKTGEIITSKDDNLLTELNSKKKKVKKESKAIPMFGITFNFNKK